MATLPKVFETHHTPRQSRGPVAVPADNGCALRPLPHDNVFFYAKKINNDRLVREPDPKARGACWRVIGAAGLAVVAFGAAMAPQVAAKMEGYKLEALRSEEQRLLDERRSLELQEAKLLSLERLKFLAEKQHLVTPTSDQVYHLETRPDGAVAMAK